MGEQDTRTDAELLRGWQGGDQAAGRELYRRHFGAVDRFFRNKVSEPEDLIQRTFATCLAAPDKFEGRSKFRTYLLGIGYRLLLRHYRDNARVEHRAELGHLSVEQLEPTPSQVLARLDAHRKLLASLRRLPLNLQVTIELRFWEDLKVREIAEALDQPQGTIKEWIRRSKVVLARSMAELDASPEHLHTTATKLEDWAAQLSRDLHGDRTGQEDA